MFFELNGQSRMVEFGNAKVKGVAERAVRRLSCLNSPGHVAAPMSASNRNRMP